MNDIYVGSGNLDGKGVYANRRFSKGEVVVKYNLKLLSQEEYKALPRSEEMFTHGHRGQIYLYSEPERYVNHSDHPNTNPDLRQHADVAIKNIEKDEMIATDATMDDVV